MILDQIRIFVVPHSKIVEYLLNSAHPDNGGKAAFFRKLGFSVEERNSLADELIAQLFGAETTIRESPHPLGYGIAVVADGFISAPTGQNARVRAVWNAVIETETATFVTAYPD